VDRVSSSFVVDLTEASRLAARAVDMLAGVPLEDRGDESTKDLRLRIYKTDMAAQSRIERQFDASGNGPAVISALRSADALLEDANWQLAKKPSPDGRFNGVDVPGAIRDMREGSRLLNELLRAAGGVPTEPSSGPTNPPAGPPAPPVTPPAPTQPTQPVPGGGDDTYPGDDEFPTDDDILGDS
jgi:hypothetical protein